MRFDSRDLTVKLWADASSPCCGCSDTQDDHRCQGCTDTQPGCQGCTDTQPGCQGCTDTQCNNTQQGRASEVPAGALALLRRQLQETLAAGAAS
jgi:hypothetical protein